MNDFAPRVLHCGPYDGQEIDTVVEIDPAYIIEVASTEHGHGISQEVVNRAYHLLGRGEDDYDEYESLEEQATAFGFHIEDFNEDD